jgi:diguanylate cyclase (GGDEF)-like protein
MAAANAIGTNALALFILAFIFANTSRRAEHAFMQHRLFTAIIGAVALLLLANSAGKAADGAPGPAAYWVNWAATLLLYTVAPYVPALYVLYAHYEVYHGEKRLRPLVWLLAAAAALDAAFNVSSIFTGWTFTIGADNIYRRGPLFFVHLLFCYLALLYAVLFILRNRRRIEKRHFLPLLAFGLLPVAAGATQELVAGLSAVIPSMSLSVLLLYLNIQDGRLDTDYLTGVYNRRLLDRYMKGRVQPGGPKKAFSAVLLDLDNFKEINDTLGHAAGDRALVDTVSLLKGCLRRGDFISRYGGDEFLIILDIGSPEVLEETVGRIRDAFRHFNEGRTRPYSLSFSTGYDVYDMACGMDPEQFVKHVDALMYAEKKKEERKPANGEADDGAQ